MGLVVVIPAYNAGRHLMRVIERVVDAALPELERIIVVNDGSTDDTPQKMAESRRLTSIIELVDRGRNGGYGAAMKDGLARASLSRPEFVACVHADGQYSPEVLAELVRESQRRSLDILQGSRVASGSALSGGMPLYKYAANAVLNRLENATLGLGMTDYHSGYLLYSARALADIPFARLSDSFDFDLEVIAAARARDLRIGEAPIPTHYGDEVSYLNPVTYGLRVLRVLWRYGRGHYDPT